MHLTKQILTLMLDGQERTIAEVVAALNCSPEKAAVAMHNGRRNGYYTIAEWHYTIADAGRSEAARKFMTDEERAAKTKLRMKKLAEKRRAERKARPPRIVPVREPSAPKVDLVSLAVATRPALDMAWMSVAREQEMTA